MADLLYKDDGYQVIVASMSHHVLHCDLFPGNDFVGTSNKGIYGDYIKELDHSTGRIVKALHDASLDDNTHVTELD